MLSLLILDSSASAQSAPPLAEELTVTATRSETRLDDSPASVVIVGRDDLDQAASPAVDDVLRSVPGFTLFRRVGSRTANPTAQGVSLRGVGASGASRTLVLWDGIPLNDPFGGWVYWGRVVSESVSRVEVLRGGGADLYGGGALAGVVNLLRRQSDSGGLSAKAALGQDGADASVWATLHRESWTIGVSGEIFDGDGYVVVDEPDRGAVDIAAFSERSVVELEGARRLTSGRFFARLSLFDEERGNGTPLQTNDTSNLQLSGGADWRGSATDFSVRVFAADQEYEQTFSAIAGDRNSERLTRAQDVPSESIGLSAVMRRGLRPDLLFVGGMEARRVEGVSREQIFGAAVQQLKSGGTQETVGGFLEILAYLTPRLWINAAGRGDFWSDDALTGSTRNSSAFSPRISATYEATSRLNLTASAYRSFRPPTLNELYRSFRVGNVLTLANEGLEPETLTGAELGVVFRNASGARVRATTFLMDVEEPVANVTLSATSELITRQRQNLGSTRSIGLEIDAEQAIGAFTINAGYLYVDATIRDGDSSLEGLRVPQVARNQATAGLEYRSARGMLTAMEVRWSDEQFEDDLNTLRLRGYLLTDVFASLPIAARWTLFASVENLFDERIEAGRTPVVTLGVPRSGRLGVRVRR